MVAVASRKEAERDMAWIGDVLLLDGVAGQKLGQLVVSPPIEIDKNRVQEGGFVPLDDLIAAAVLHPKKGSLLAEPYLPHADEMRQETAYAMQGWRQTMFDLHRPLTGDTPAEKAEKWGTRAVTMAGFFEHTGRTVSVEHLARPLLQSEAVIEYQRRHPQAPAASSPES